jgi:hypothetical protein
LVRLIDLSAESWQPFTLQFIPFSTLPIKMQHALDYNKVRKFRRAEDLTLIK